MNNTQRAEWGSKAVPVGNPDHGDSMRDPSIGLEITASDTVANILHYVNSQGGDVERVLRMASSNYEAEIEEESK